MMVQVFVGKRYIYGLSILCLIAKYDRLENHDNLLAEVEIACYALLGEHI